MKTLIKILGSITLFFIAIGTLFKLQHWPGASIMLLIGNMTIIIGFLPTYFGMRLYNSQKKIETLYNMIGLISLMMLFTGALFKINHWPGASVMLIFGTILFALLALPLFIFSSVKDPDKKTTEISAIVFIGVFLSFFFILIALKPSKNNLLAYNTLNKQYLQSNLLLNEINKKYNTSLINKNKTRQGLASINSKADSMKQFIRETKQQLIKAADGPDDIESKMNNPEKINAKDNIDIPTFIMAGPTIGHNRNTKGAILKTMIDEYKYLTITFIDSLSSSKNDSIIMQIEDLFKPVPSIYNSQLNWEQKMFYNTPLSATLAILTGIEHKIIGAEILVKEHVMQMTEQPME
jgi:hypothetical protein